MKKVFVNGYGSIGSRIAKFIKNDSDIDVIGIGKHSSDEKVQHVIDDEFSVYVPENKIDDFKDYNISGSIESVLDDCDLVIVVYLHSDVSQSMMHKLNFSSYF